jgi:energy-coupling factor transporter ATP-binding protein EcfA2
VLFLDEPFSALDFEMTLFIREKLQEVFMQTGTTMLLVSHDLEEAVYLADQVLLLTKRPTKVAEILPTATRDRARWTRCRASFIAPRSSAWKSSSARCADEEIMKTQTLAYVKASCRGAGPAAGRPRRRAARGGAHAAHVAGLAAQLEPSRCRSIWSRPRCTIPASLRKLVDRA